MKELKGGVAVVTGAAQGIGRGIARALAADGCRVVVSDLSADGAEAVAEELRGRGIEAIAASCDVRDRAQVEALAETAWGRFGRVDLLVNNAGVIQTGAAVDATEADMQWVFGVNLFGVWTGCAVFTKRFRQQGGPAHILNVGSEHSISFPFPDLGIYTASKHAVLALCEVLRAELEEDDIGVSILCPAVTATALGGAGQHRPAELGGPFELDPDIADLLAGGLDPDDVGRGAVDGVRRGDFYIVTHPEVREKVEHRYRELIAAFDAQAPQKP